MYHFTIVDEFLYPEETTDESSFCIVAYNNYIESLLVGYYGQYGLCLKIFKQPAGEGETADSFRWGGVSLRGCVVIQNLFARAGIAPRVFDVVRVNDDRLALVTPFLPPGIQPSAERVDRLRQLADDYKLGVRKNHWDVNPRNWRCGLFVDFSGFHFEDPHGYEAALVRQAHTRRGEYIGMAYQPVDELNIRGTRDMETRIKAMRLGEIDFTGKTVLDIGCNLGYLCRWATEQGAWRVVGVDRIADLTFQIANWMGDWQTDYLCLRLPDEVGGIAEASGIREFDVVIATAVVKHLGGMAPWLRELCADLFIFEGHGTIEAAVYEPQLRDHFETVNYIGQTDDNYARHLFQCRV